MLDANIALTCSLPDLDETITANGVNRRVILVDNEVVHRSLVCLHLLGDFVALQIDKLDVAVGAADENLLARLVELAAMCDSVTRVNISDLLHHADVPNLDNSIRVDRANVLASNAESCIINAVEMAKEGLHGQSRPHIPDGHASIG